MRQRHTWGGVTMGDDNLYEVGPMEEGLAEGLA